VEQHTIVAQATPPGRGGVAILRISGSLVTALMLPLFGTTLTPRVATYLPFLDEDNNIIDEGIAIFFASPHSFTGEDVLELQGHGGPIIVDLLLQRILKLGVQLARPGEFSERAFLNGKMDLTQAEAIADLINASSEQAARSAVRSLQGEFSRQIRAITKKIIALRMYIEAAIDFSEEEIDFLTNEKVTSDLHSLLTDTLNILTIAKQSCLLREGIAAVIVGEPNVGKSSLLNCLSGKDIAIVTDQPGTTRDVLRDYILIDGMPMHIIDTAGLRETTDIIEQEGIKRAYHELSQADIVLYMRDATQHEEIDIATLPQVVAGKPVVVIYNKIDLLEKQPTIESQTTYPVVYLSAKTQTGISTLKQAIKTQVGYEAQSESAFLARQRHLDALNKAQIHIKAALHQQTTTAMPELMAEDLRLAQRALGEITGEFSTDDLLGEIFSHFCVGK
jgi:tRNA modification GTPase